MHEKVALMIPKFEIHFVVFIIHTRLPSSSGAQGAYAYTNRMLIQNGGGFQRHQPIH